mgnify:FL=1
MLLRRFGQWERVTTASAGTVLTPEMQGYLETLTTGAPTAMLEVMDSCGSSTTGICSSFHQDQLSNQDDGDPTNDGTVCNVEIGPDVFGLSEVDRPADEIPQPADNRSIV